MPGTVLRVWEMQQEYIVIAKDDYSVQARTQCKHGICMDLEHRLTLSIKHLLATVRVVCHLENQSDDNMER